MFYSEPLIISRFAFQIVIIQKYFKKKLTACVVANGEENPSVNPLRAPAIDKDGILSQLMLNAKAKNVY